MKKTFQHIFVSVAFLSLIFVVSARQSTAFDQAAQLAAKAQEQLFHTTLPNGLEVVVYPKTDVPDVYMQLVYKIGSRHEKTEDTYGFAHLLEHMVFKGTTKNGLHMSESDIWEIGKKLHLSGINANTWYDRTLYFFHADTSNWETFFDILADCMGNLALNDEHLNSEMNAVYQEIKMGARDGSIDVLAEVLPKGHPYSHDVIGYKENILRAHTDELRKFYEDHYGPNNAALIVVGNVTPEQIQERANRCYGAYKPAPVTTRGLLDTQGYTTVPRRSDLSSKHCKSYSTIPKEYISCVWQVPGARSEEHVVAQAVKALLGLRIQRRLYDKDKAVIQYGVHVYPFLVDSAFTIALRPQDTAFPIVDNKTLVLKDGQVLPYCLEAVEQEIAKVIQDGFDADELQRYKTTMITDFIKSFESVGAIGSWCMQNYLEHDLQAQFQDTPAKIQAVTNDDVKRFAYTYLRPIQMSTFHYLPVPNDEKENWMQLRSQVDQHDIALLMQRQRTEPVEPPRLAHKVDEPEPLPFSFKNPDSMHTLSNGMKVYLKKNDTLPFVSLRCGILNHTKVMRHFQLINQAAIPSLAMGLLSEGSEKYSKQELEDFFDSYGATTFANDTGVGLRCLKSDFVQVATRVLHVLRQPAFDNDVFQVRRGDSITHLKMSKKVAHAVLHEDVCRVLFSGTFRAQSTDEAIVELESYTRQDLINFHKQVIDPSNLFLVVVGDFEVEDMIGKLENLVGSWKVASDFIPTTKPYKALSNPESSESASFLPEDQMALCIARLTVDREDDDYFALRLLQGYVRKRIFDIRQQTGIFYTFGTCLAGYATDEEPGYAQVYTQVAVANVEPALKAIKAVLNDIAQNGMPEEELVIAQNSLQNDLARSFLTTSQQCESYVGPLLEGKDFDEYEKCLKRYKSVTIEQIRDVAKRYLNTDEWSTFKVGRAIT